MDRIAELKKNVLDKRWSIDKIFIKAIDDLADGIVAIKTTDPLEQRVQNLESVVRKQGEAIKQLAAVLYKIRDLNV